MNKHDHTPLTTAEISTLRPFDRVMVGWSEEIYGPIQRAEQVPDAEPVTYDAAD